MYISTRPDDFKCLSKVGFGESGGSWVPALDFWFRKWRFEIGNLSLHSGKVSRAYRKLRSLQNKGPGYIQWLYSIH